MTYMSQKLMKLVLLVALFGMVLNAPFDHAFVDDYRRISLALKRGVSCELLLGLEKFFKTLAQRKEASVEAHLVGILRDEHTLALWNESCGKHAK
ncbi:hypothetical protein TYRP_022416 [Tyrophagus putrescentiae]|nr:hypothetical protein TYRP_022416 [Tyrophagus putrescentiae]